MVVVVVVVNRHENVVVRIDTRCVSPRRSLVQDPLYTVKGMFPSSGDDLSDCLCVDTKKIAMFPRVLQHVRS